MKGLKIQSQIPLFLISFGILLLVSSCQTQIATPESVGLSGDSLKIATQRLHKYVDEGKLPGTFVRIIKDGKVVYNDQYGLIDIAKNKPVEEQSLYRIFSMTKPITAVAIMTLYDQGKLDLDDKVSKYIPEFSKTEVYKNIDGEHTTEPQKNPMTLRHLLTHTSGIPYGWESSYTDSIYNARQPMRQDWSIEEMSKDLASIPLKFQPGTKWNYGLGIDVAGYIVEVVSGKKLDAYFKSAIFDPLGMDDTRFYVPKEKMGQLSELYTRDENNKLVVVNDPDMQKKIGAHSPPKLLLGGAGLISTLTDYENFCRMLLNKGELNGKRVLSQKAAEMVITNQYPDEMKAIAESGHGLSGTVNLENGEYNWGGAASTSFWINPTDDLIVICYTQLFASQTTYASEFKATVDRAIIDQN
jgi:CubicO group peptidase (beta-lactamase class C family)